jgi:hypothetical protein
VSTAQAHKMLSAFELACLGLVTLGWKRDQSRMPRPRRYAGVLVVFAILGLVAEWGQSLARLAAAAGGVLTLTLAMNAVVAERLIGKPTDWIPAKREGGGYTVKKDGGGFLGAVVRTFSIAPAQPGGQTADTESPGGQGVPGYISVLGGGDVARPRPSTPQTGAQTL